MRFSAGALAKNQTLRIKPALAALKLIGSFRGIIRNRVLVVD